MELAGTGSHTGPTPTPNVNCVVALCLRRVVTPQLKNRRPPVVTARRERRQSRERQSVVRYTRKGISEASGNSRGRHALRTEGARRKPKRVTRPVRAPRGIALPRRQTNGASRREACDGKTSERWVYGPGAMQSETKAAERRPQRAARRRRKWKNSETRMWRREGRENERKRPTAGLSNERVGGRRSTCGPRGPGRRWPRAAAGTGETAAGLKTRRKQNEQSIVQRDWLTETNRAKPPREQRKREGGTWRRRRDKDVRGKCGGQNDNGASEAKETERVGPQPRDGAGPTREKTAAGRARRGAVRAAESHM